MLWQVAVVATIHRRALLVLTPTEVAQRVLLVGLVIVDVSATIKALLRVIVLKHVCLILAESVHPSEVMRLGRCLRQLIISLLTSISLVMQI